MPDARRSRDPGPECPFAVRPLRLSLDQYELDRNDHNSSHRPPGDDQGPDNRR
jgi:hypothetical protein